MFSLREFPNVVLPLDRCIRERSQKWGYAC